MVRAGIRFRYCRREQQYLPGMLVKGLCGFEQTFIFKVIVRTWLPFYANYGNAAILKGKLVEADDIRKTWWTYLKPLYGPLVEFEAENNSNDNGCVTYATISTPFTTYYLPHVALMKTIAEAAVKYHEVYDIRGLHPYTLRRQEQLTPIDRLLGLIAEDELRQIMLGDVGVTGLGPKELWIPAHWAQVMTRDMDGRPSDKAWVNGSAHGYSRAWTENQRRRIEF
ncbi:hypothetical protein BC832DRAFT_615984 [Gaertneriomyces semiglobifer]|nr:hypothetical protein BC832DRAFT_615984 [Gaertneriomyces semiglobifer]